MSTNNHYDVHTRSYCSTTISLHTVVNSRSLISRPVAIGSCGYTSEEFVDPERAELKEIIFSLAVTVESAWPTDAPESIGPVR